LLAELAIRLRELPWDTASLETAVRDFAEARGLKLGQAAQPLRAALTGSTASPPIFDVMAVLGRGESLARLADASNP
jgi:glutamyl-tRNA synthetase